MPASKVQTRPAKKTRAKEVVAKDAREKNGLAADAPGVAAVSRAIQIMTSFEGADGGLPLSELARRTGLYKSTILRLTGSLGNHGFIERDGEGRFTLGRELIRLGEMAKRMRRSSAIIVNALERLTRETGESSTFCVRQGERRLALFRVDSPRSVRDSIRAGDLLPLDRGAAGRVIKQFENNAHQLIDLIVSRGERDPEVAAVAGPIYSNAKFEGALSVSGPRSRLSETRLKEIARSLLPACEALTRQLS